jgi:hypothetical protein
MKKRRILVIGLAAAALPLLAQSSADPAALTSLRQRYQALLQEAEGPPRSRWQAAMESLEKQKVEAGDFDGAALVRAKRLGQSSGAAAAALGKGPVILNGAMARTGTALDFADSKKEVARFRRSGAMMEWDLPGQVPGTYQVNLFFSVMGDKDENDQPDPFIDPKTALPVRNNTSGMESMAGGVVEFRKITNLKEGGTLLRRSVRSTGGWAKPRSITLGTVELDSKISKFSLRAVDGLPAGVMDFQRIELVPLNQSSTPGVAADPAGLKEFTRLKEVYQKQFSDQTRSLTARYLKNLAELEVAALRAGDNDNIALIRQEKKRIEAGGTAPATAVAADATFVLPVTEKLYMMVRGEAKLTNQGDYLTRLRPAKTGEVIWKLAGLGIPSGTYTVELNSRLSPGNGGKATLQAGSTGGEAGPVLDFEVKAYESKGGNITTIINGNVVEKPDQPPIVQTQRIGKVTIPRGAQYLTLRVESLANPQSWLCDLKNLTLKPVTP